MVFRSFPALVNIFCEREDEVGEESNQDLQGKNADGGKTRPRKYFPTPLCQILAHVRSVESLRDRPTVLGSIHVAKVSMV